MSRYREPICRLCRVEKAKLFLKGNKCLTEKCPIERRGYPPGQHGRSRRRILGYGDPAPGKAEAEKVLRDVRKAVPPLLREGGAAEGHHRRDASVDARAAAGQRHFHHRVRPLPGPRPAARSTTGISIVNDARVTVPSFQVKAGRSVTFRERSAKNENVKALLEAHKNKAVPGWLEVDWAGERPGSCPSRRRADITLPVEEHMVVELYSK